MSLQRRDVDVKLGGGIEAAALFRMKRPNCQCAPAFGHV